MSASEHVTATSLPSRLRLAGRRIVVTGAAGGIGQATACVLASLGAQLVLVDTASLDAMGAKLPAGAPEPETIEVDLLTVGAIDRLFAGGRVHALVHCAAIIPARPWHEDTDRVARFERTAAVNIRLPIEIGFASIDHMAANGGGKVVFLSSVAGWSGGTTPATPPDYVASKGSILSLVRLLARRGAPSGVLVNGVAPGPVDTPFSAGSTYPPGTFPLGRMAEADEVAWPCAFLCTDAASYLSGEIINVNGGLFFA